MIEIEPVNTGHNLHILLSHEKIPTFKSFDFITKVSDLPLNDSLEAVNIDFKFNFWFLNNSLLQNRTGRWFMNVMDLKEELTDEELTDRSFSKTKIGPMTTDYKLRTYTAGCYYLDEKYEEWTGRGMTVLNTSYEITTCLTSHMTLFGAGFFIQPNSMDFNFLYAEHDFSVNIQFSYFDPFMIIYFYRIIFKSQSPSSLVSSSF